MRRGNAAAIVTGDLGLGPKQLGVFMFRIFALTPLALLLLVAASPVADPPAFGARESILDIALSPSGRKVAFIGPGPAQATVLYTADAAGGASPRQALGANGRPERFVARIPSCVQP